MNNKIIQDTIVQQQQLLVVLQNECSGNCHPQLLQYLIDRTQHSIQLLELSIAEPVADSVTLDKLTPEYVKQYWYQTNRQSSVARTCSICESPLHYLNIGGELHIDTNCGCSRYRSATQIVGWNRIVDSIARQEPQHQTQIAADLGINLVKN